MVSITGRECTGIVGNHAQPITGNTTQHDCRQYCSTGCWSPWPCSPKHVKRYVPSPQCQPRAKTSPSVLGLRREPTPMKQALGTSRGRQARRGPQGSCSPLWGRCPQGSTKGGSRVPRDTEGLTPTPCRVIGGRAWLHLLSLTSSPVVFAESWRPWARKLRPVMTSISA